MSSQFTESYFGIARRYVQVATGDACSVVVAQEVADRYRSDEVLRFPHWLRVKSLCAGQLEIEVFGKTRSCDMEAIIVARRRDSKVIILREEAFNEEFVAMGERQHIDTKRSMGLFDERR